MEEKLIVVIGAGFGGITAALKLEKKLRRFPGYHIILIDKNAYQLYTPALYEIAAIPREEASASVLKPIIIIPIEEIVARKRIQFLQGEVVGINREKRTISLKDGKNISFTFLVLALGSETNYFNIPGLKEHAYPLKQFRDAIRIRNRIEKMVEEKSVLNIVVGGAGAAGVELISELANFICYLQQKVLTTHTCANRLILIEASATVLSGVDQWTVEQATERLQVLGIEIKTSTRIVRIDSASVETDNQKRIPCDLLVWTGGVTGNSFCSSLGLPLTRKNNLAVNEFLEAEKNIFVVGDAAGFTDKATGQLLPWTVPIAEVEGKIIAQNIARVIAGKAKIPFHPLRHYPYILTIGKKYALANLVVLHLKGFLGWLIKILVELRYLLFILPPIKAFRIWWKGVRIYSSND